MTPVSSSWLVDVDAGSELGVSEWFALTQGDVDDHARRTGDDDWVHTDPERVAAEGVLGGCTIVQGSLILSQLVRLVRVVPRPAGVRFAARRAAPVAVVTVVAGFDAEAARRALRSVLAPYKVPRRITAVAALPRLPLGEIDRVAVMRLVDGVRR